MQHTDTINRHPCHIEVPVDGQRRAIKGGNKGAVQRCGHARVCPWKSTAAGGMREKVLIILDLTWSMGQGEGGPEAGAVKHCNHTSLCPPGGAG